MLLPMFGALSRDDQDSVRVHVAEALVSLLTTDGGDDAWSIFHTLAMVMPVKRTPARALCTALTSVPMGGFRIRRGGYGILSRSS